jgi:hypothetical protein
VLVLAAVGVFPAVALDGVATSSAALPAKELGAATDGAATASVGETVVTATPTGVAVLSGMLSVNVPITSVGGAKKSVKAASVCVKKSSGIGVALADARAFCACAGVIEFTCALG